MGRPYKCPYCGQNNSIAKGFRRNTGGKVRLRRCRSCGRRWTVKDSLAPHNDSVPVPSASQEESPTASDGLGDETPEADGAETGEDLPQALVEENSRYVEEKKPEPDGSGQEKTEEKNE
ncbi:MAG: IS1 family transposase [Lentisphaerae bacterium]|jgi:hypothetical protein|nr:IS1 family transposase [Lentisphaerota bacterium]MBT5611645.1 IS1 family transposase [Lentisphaerota bacterium]